MSAKLVRQQIEEISCDEKLKRDLEILPGNYTFEVPKTIWKIRSTASKTVALQFPEGLLMYSCVIADLLTKYTGAEVVIMGDVTYGACCVDPFTAKALGELSVDGCELLVHYGHSCLVPIQETPGIHLLYVFVNIDINLRHLIECIRENFAGEKTIALVSTIQFVASLQAVKRALTDEAINITIPQCSPLSPGEILGCTSPVLSKETSALIYVGDGRFHLESVMMQNPWAAAYQYNPYSRELTKEEFGFDTMISNREKAISAARESKNFGLILGTLGRQGNMKIFEDLEAKLKSRGKTFIRVLLSEIFSNKLKAFEAVDCWVQVACPRLSIDWGHAFDVPLLTPYELAAALDYTDFSKTSYPMDYYAYASKGPWTNNHESHRPAKRVERKHIALKAS